MRVGHVVHAMVVGGAETLVASLLRASDSGQEPPIVFCLDAVGPIGESLRAEGFVVEVLGRNPGVDRSLVGRLAEAFRQHEIEVVHCHQYTPWFYGTLAASKLSLPVVFTEHGRHQPDKPRIKRVLFNQWLLRKTKAITAVSESIREALVKNEWLPRRRVELLYNGIDTAKFRPDETERPAVRAELGLQTDDVMVLTAGRLFEVKNQRMLMRAARRLLDKGRTDLHFFIAGDGPLREELKSELALLDLGTHFHFLGERNDVARLLRGADIFTLTSWSEGTSITLLEAMSTSLPVVVTEVGGNPELVCEGEHGHLVPSDDDEMLSSAISRLADDAASRRELGAAGRQNVLDRFSFDAMRARFDAIHAEVLGS